MKVEFDRDRPYVTTYIISMVLGLVRKRSMVLGLVLVRKLMAYGEALRERKLASHPTHKAFLDCSPSTIFFYIWVDHTVCI